MASLRGRTLSAGNYLRAALDGASYQPLDLLHGGGVNERPLLNSFDSTVSDAQLLGRGAQPFDESIVHALLDQNPISADASLTGVPILGRHRALNGCIEIGVVED